MSCLNTAQCNANEREHWKMNEGGNYSLQSLPHFFLFVYCSRNWKQISIENIDWLTWVWGKRCGQEEWRSEIGYSNWQWVRWARGAHSLDRKWNGRILPRFSKYPCLLYSNSFASLFACYTNYAVDVTSTNSNYYWIQFTIRNSQKKLVNKRNNRLSQNFIDEKNAKKGRIRTSGT